MKRIGVAAVWALALLFSFFIFDPQLTLRSGRHTRDLAARSQIDQLLTALRTYRLDVGAFPTEEQGLQALRTDPGVRRWNGPYVEKDIPVDPWGVPYRYGIPNGRPRIVSLGGGSPNGERAISSESPPR